MLIIIIIIIRYLAGHPYSATLKVCTLHTSKFHSSVYKQFQKKTLLYPG